jgi:O-antigen/teichoic acid export membrane protein
LGIIQKQATQSTIVSLVGTAIGAVSQVMLPFIFVEEDQIGALSLLNSISKIFATIFTLGFAQITLQVFSSFRNDEKGHSGFLMFAMLYSIAGAGLGLITFYWFHDFFVGVGDDYKLIRSISYLIFPIIFFKIFFANLDAYMRMLFASVVGIFWEGLMLKLGILVGVLLFWLGWIDFQYTAYVYSFALSLPGIALIYLTFKKTAVIQMPERSLLAKDKRSAIISYGVYGILGAASSILVVSIDQVMLNKMVGTDAVGVYSVLFFAGMLISIPARGIKRISASVLSESWKKNDKANIQLVYEKSVNNQTVIGIYLFVVGWLCIEPALTFLPDYQFALYVFFFVGLGQLFDMMTGINSEIIATSQAYKMNTYFNFVLAVLVIGLNFVFIQEWSVVGAAAASAIAMFIVNIARWFYLKQKFDFQPFDKRTLYHVGIGFLLVLFFKWLPLPLNPLTQMLVYIVAITLIFWTIIFYFDLAPDLKKWWKKILSRINPS